MIMPPHLHFLHMYPLCLFLVNDPLLFVPSSCLRKSVCWIGCCLILPHLLSHLVLVANCRINFSLVFVASFLSLGFLEYLFFNSSLRQNSSPPSLSVQGYCHWEARDLLPDCLAGQVG